MNDDEQRRLQLQQRAAERSTEWLPLWLMGPVLAISVTMALIAVTWVAAYFKWL